MSLGTILVAILALLFFGGIIYLARTSRNPSAQGSAGTGPEQITKETPVMKEPDDPKEAERGTPRKKKHGRRNK
jgi:hypothetical protein